MGMVKSLRAKCGIVLLAAAMVASSVFIPGAGGSMESYAASFSDISKHWAKSYIEKAVDYGFVNGYENGTFKPDASITRAEFTKMVNSVLGNDGTADIAFDDVQETDWYYDDICKGVAAAFISGYSASEFAPANSITRQEAAVMLSRIVPSYGKNVTLKVFGDYEDIDFWAEDACSKIVGKGYLGGYDDGDLHPADSLTRAQAAKLLVDVYENENIVSKNQTVVQSGVKLEDTIYTNRISVGEKVGDGNVDINNCVILGTLNIEGGGNDDTDGNVRILNSRVANARIHRNSAAVLVQAYGESTVVHSEVTDEACLEELSLKGSGDFGKGFVNVSVGRAAYTSLIGDFESVTITDPKVDLMIEEGTVDQLSADITATKTNVSISINAAVNTADIRAEGLVFEGDGTVKQLNAKADGITYETEPESITTASNVKVAPKQVYVQRVTPLLTSLSVRYLGDDADASYTNLPVSSSDFNYYIPSSATDLTLNFRAVTDETAEGYVPEPEYSVKYGSDAQRVSTDNGQASCEISIGAGTSSETITVTVSSGTRGYGQKTYRINLKRINPAFGSVYNSASDITDKLYSSLSAAQEDPCTVSGRTADITVNLKEIANADFVTYSVYKVSGSKIESVAEGISGGNTVTLDVGEAYRIVTECRCYSDSYAGCKTVRGVTRYLVLE